MSRIGIAFVIPGLALALAACNTTDALTPQVDVGDTRSQSSPVTQGDLDQMASAADSAPSGYSAAQVPAYSPQNTLDAQAKALANGAQYGEPMQTAQAYQPPPAEPSPAQTAAAQQSASIAPSSASGSIRFLPIIGAPVQAVTPLSRQLGAEARAKGLTIRASTDTSTEHILKGYLSAFPDGGKVSVVYVWDVLDNSGARLHRLQGQEQVAARGNDPWSAVSDATMQQIAAKTLNEYLAWKQAQPG